MARTLAVFQMMLEKAGANAQRARQGSFQTFLAWARTQPEERLMSLAGPILLAGKATNSSSTNGSGSNGRAYRAELKLSDVEQWPAEHRLQLAGLVKEFLAYRAMQAAKAEADRRDSEEQERRRREIERERRRKDA